MEFKWIVIFLLLNLTFISITCVVSEDVNSTPTSKRLKDTPRKPKPSKSRGVKSIRSEDGDIIDCVDIYKQPAFDHPALKNHTIQMTPTNALRNEKTSAQTEMDTSTTKQGFDNIITSQLWQRSGSCPKGSIPIRRIPKKHLLKHANAAHAYGRKNPRNHVVMQSNDTTSFHMPNHSTATLITEGYSYSGGKANIKVWNPFVESEDEYSTSMVSLQNGAESVESGWAVNPRVYKDHQTRYYVYWTVDASEKTGCFDLTCPGFVQVNHEIALGGAIFPISNPTGLPYEIIVYVHKDPITNNWWVQFGEKISIGYWPGELFRLLNYHAVIVSWGGEVYSSRVKIHPHHTQTNMGSGHWPDWIFQHSGTITRMRVKQNSHELMFPEWVSAYSDEYECYDVFYISDYVDDPQFFYGGPGRNDRCP